METVTWTLGEVADLLKVSGLTVRRMWCRGQFPAPIAMGRIIRWRAADVERWLAEQPTSTLYEQKEIING